LAVRLFIGNLPYGASEADLRAHFAAVAEPSHVAMPVDRETGRPRGFAFVEFAERTVAEEVIRKFDSQPFQGRPLAVSEARAREDRPPRPPGGGGFAPRPGGGGGGFGGPRPGAGGFGGPRPGGGGFGGPRPGGGGFGGPPTGPGGRDRSANFGPPAPPKRLRGKKTAQQEHKPRGPIKERSGGRIYAVDDLEDDSAVEIDDIATKANEDESTVEIDDIATKSNGGVDDQDEE
jgi:RNA recognition motif-containing protein